MEKPLEKARHWIHCMFEKMTEELLLPPVPPDWRCPFFGVIVDTIRSHLAVDRSVVKPNRNETPAVYILEEGFVPNDRYWMGNIQRERMTSNSKVLYRPKIVEDLVQQITSLLKDRDTTELLVTGRPGVGKSYTLINLTRYLLVSQEYLVTFIPDCDKWTSPDDFFNVILESVGVQLTSTLRTSFMISIKF